jgi:hypothetical protein
MLSLLRDLETRPPRDGQTKGEDGLRAVFYQHAVPRTFLHSRFCHSLRPVCVYNYTSPVTVYRPSLVYLAPASAALQTASRLLFTPMCFDSSLSSSEVVVMAACRKRSPDQSRGQLQGLDVGSSDQSWLFTLRLSLYFLTLQTSRVHARGLAFSTTVDTTR